MRRLVAALPLAVAVASLAFALPRPALAATAAPAPPGSGIDGLMPGPDLRHGNQPTLAEKYPAASYGLNVDPGSALLQLIDNPGAATVNFALSVIAGMGVTFLTILGIITSRLLEWTFTLDLVDTLGAPVAGVVDALHQGFYEPLIKPVITIAGLILLWRVTIRRRLLHTLDGLFWIILAVGVSAIYFSAPLQVIGGIQRFTLDVSRDILATVAAADPAAHDATSASGPASDAELRVFTDRYWRTFVFEPYTVVLLGDVKQGPLAEEYLKKQAGQGNDFDNQFQRAPQYNKDWFNGRHAGEQVVYAALGLLVLIPASILFIVIAGIVIVAQLALLLLMAVAPIFFLVGTLPGGGRRLMARWVQMAAGPFAITILFSALLSVMMVVGGSINRGVSQLSWGLTGLLQFALVFAVIWWRKPFIAVFGQVWSGHWATTHAAHPGVAYGAHQALGSAQGWMTGLRARAQGIPPAAAGQGAGAAAARAAAGAPAGVRTAANAVGAAAGGGGGAGAAAAGGRAAAGAAARGVAARLGAAGAGVVLGPAIAAAAVGQAAIRAHHRGRRQAEGLAGHFMFGAQANRGTPPPPPVRSQQRGRPLPAAQVHSRRQQWRDSARPAVAAPPEPNGHAPTPAPAPEPTRVNIARDSTPGFEGWTVQGSPNGQGSSIAFTSREAAAGYASMHGWTVE